MKTSNYQLSKIAKNSWNKESQNVMTFTIEWLLNRCIRKVSFKSCWITIWMNIFWMNYSPPPPPPIAIPLLPPPLWLTMKLIKEVKALEFFLLRMKSVRQTHLIAVFRSNASAYYSHDNTSFPGSSFQVNSSNDNFFDPYSKSTKKKFRFNKFIFIIN